MDLAVSRPNPFTIPSGTLIRFVLLIVASSATALTYLIQDIAVMLGVHQDKVIAYQKCVERITHEEVTQRQINRLLLRDCHDPRSDVGLWPHIISLGFFWMVVLVVYWWLPKWRIRRRRLSPLAIDQLPELAGYLRDLQRETGARERVTYLLEPLNPKVTGLAFGRIGRRYIMLSGGLVALFTRDRPAFRTVVLHELAHVHNRDLDITLMTIAVWRLVAFLLARRFLGASLAILSGIWPVSGILTEAVGTVQNVLLALFVPLIKNAVLRSRELYADARMALWNSSTGGLLHLFDTYSSHRRSQFGRLLRAHPDLKERDKALTGAQNLFTAGFWEMLAVGMMVILTINQISGFITHPTGSIAAVNIAVLFAAPLLALGAGFSIWREAIRSFVSRTPMNVKRAGLGLGIGFTIGTVITQDAYLLYVTRTSPLSALSLIIPCLVLLFFSGLFIARWIALVARSWLPVIVNSDRPVLVIIGTLIAMSIPLAIWLDVTEILPGMTVYVHTFVSPHLPAVVIFFKTAGTMIFGRPVTVVIPLLLTLALIPVIGHAWGHRSRRTTGLQNSITLDPTPTDQPPIEPNLDLRHAIRVGLLSALGGTVITQILLALTGSATTMLHVAIIGGVVQIIAAIFVSARVQHLRSPHGVVAAFIAGIIVLLANLADWRFLTGSSSPISTSMMWTVLVTVGVAWALSAATAAALVTAKVAFTIRWFRRVREPRSSFNDKHGRRTAVSGRQ